ncbi:hypothetical protein AB0K48_22320 [Nonomuraea sp. NPDC055795]
MAETWTLWDAELGYSHTSLLQGDGAQAEQQPMPDGAEPIWGVAVVRADGGAHMLLIPHSTWEWRSAKYGIDPDDLDTLLDVVLHEPWIPDPHDALAHLNPATAAQLEATHGSPTCWTPGVSDSERLAAHRVRIAAVKEHRVQLLPETQAFRQEVLDYIGLQVTAPADPLEPIKTTVRLDPARVNARRMAVDRYRSKRAALAAPTYAASRRRPVDDRHDQLVRQVEQGRAAREALEERLAELEREAVTRTQLSDRTKLIITIVGLMVTIAAAVMTFVQLTRG